MDDIHLQCVQHLQALNDDGIAYIASPYSHPLKEVRDMRYDLVTTHAATLKENYNLTMILPITMSAQMCEKNNSLKSDWDTWGFDDLKLLSKCSSLIVVQLIGWELSDGVEKEINAARESKLPIYYYDPYTSKFVMMELSAPGVSYVK